MPISSSPGAGDQNQSSLRQAVDRILGFAPGGQATSEIQAGARAPFSQNLGTSIAVQNTPFEDPNTVAARQAVADAQASTAAMQGQLNALNAPAAAATAAAPAVVKPAAPVFTPFSDFADMTKPTKYGADPALHIKAMQTGQVLTQPHFKTFKQGGAEFDWSANAWRALESMNADKFRSWQAQQASALPGAATPSNTAAVGQAPLTPSNVAAAAARPAALTAPIRPTGNVSWQADQQYWRNLDAFNKANKLGAYK
jgi:hypothetical protein